MKTLEGKEQENSYDGEGLRAGLTENGKKITFLYHNGEILTESDGESAPIKRYLRGIGLSHVQTQDNEAYHAYHQDEQGSTAFITGQGRETENIYQYDAFGNLLEKREDVGNRILYTAQQYDQETGQYYLRARYYNPVVGRFLQEDTYRGDGLNLYAYCANNPVVYYDPSGHMPQYVEGGVKGSGDTQAGQVGNGGDIPTNRIPDNTSIIGHIFKDTEGHIPDTPENRSLLEEVANDLDNYRGNDQYDNAWYSKILEDGRQVWIQIRDGIIFDGGINDTPKQWNPKTGYKKP